MPYQLYQIERAKSSTEIRRADMQLGLMAEAASRLWHRVTQPIGLGPAMAFLVTGAGTSIAAISGAFIIARARVIALVVAVLFAGALVLGGLTGAILS